mmetsp:Transcript_7770/g.11767  ORF Transcript_7770/g.11767 Transcript_7770/m.11767 type:complete len:352 (+) Transcript_7770:3-1058(+)
MIILFWLLIHGLTQGLQTPPSGRSYIQKRQVVADLEVIASTLDSEADTALRGLQTLLPGRNEPWNYVDIVPRHRYRTFDMNKKFERVVSELKISSLSEMVLLLRMLFEEDRVGTAQPRRRLEMARVSSTKKTEKDDEIQYFSSQHSTRRRGPRPLTAGEIIENWNEVLALRCMTAWLQDGYPTFQSIESKLEEMVEITPPNLRFDVTSALRESAQRGVISEDLPLVIRQDGVFTHLHHDLDLGHPLFAQAHTIGSPTVLADLLLNTHEANGQPDSSLLYFSASAGLALQVATALRSSSNSKAANNIHIFHCAWSTRWGGLHQRRLCENNRLDVAVLDNNLRDFRRILGLPP